MKIKKENLADRFKKSLIKIVIKMLLYSQMEKNNF